MGKAGERSAAQRREHPPGWGRATDAAHQDVYFDNAVTSGSQTFEYDALYRLVRATGREHQSIADVIIGVDGAPIQTLPDPSDPTAVRAYEETYLYDAVGNILQLFHSGAGSPADTWTRTYDCGSALTNRLDETTGGATYLYDERELVDVERRELRRDGVLLVAVVSVAGLDGDRVLFGIVQPRMVEGAEPPHLRIGDVGVLIGDRSPAGPGVEVLPG